MNEQQITKTLDRLLKKIDSKLSIKELDPKQPLTEQLLFDSLNLLDFLLLIQEEYQLEISENDYFNLTTLEKIRQAIMERSKV